MKRPAWFLAVGVALTLVACHLQPGEAALAFKGEHTGFFEGGGVTCPPVSSVSASWLWSGEVRGRPMSVGAHALNSTGVPDALLIHLDGNAFTGRKRYPDEAPADGQFTARVDENDRALLHIDGSAVRDGFEPVRIHGKMRCPCAAPPCLP